MINYNANDIQLYISGKMAAGEMHAFEEAMMNDPMLADAVDGYRFAMEDTNVQEDLTLLNQQIEAAKITPGKVVRGSFRQWMSIAAGLIVLLSTAVVLYRIFYYTSDSKNNDLAVVTKKDSVIVTQKETTVDSNSVAVNDKTKADVEIAAPPKPVIIPSATELKSQKQSSAETTVRNDNTTGAIAIPQNAPPIANKPNASSTAKENATVKSNAAEVQMETDKKTEEVVFKKFTGRVVDDSNNPLPFANVTEQRSRVGTYADINGNFVLLSSDSILTIETKSVGYTKAVTQIKNNQTQKIILNDEAVVAIAPSAEGLYKRNKDRVSKIIVETNEMYAEPSVGWGNYNTYVANNLKEPELFKEKQAVVKKQVELSFAVNPDGTISNVKVERSNCNQCNTEAIRILKEGPLWKSKSGKKETARFTVQF